MRNLPAALITEFIKIHRSKMFWITICFFTFIPLMMGLMMYIAQNPEIGAKLGLVGVKASLFGKNDWAGYIDVLNQSIATIGLIGFGFVTSWVFGREYMEHTLIDILALPTNRSSIVTAKFIIIFIWCILLATTLFLVGTILGMAMDIPGWSHELFNQFFKKYYLVSFLTILLSSPIAFLASYGRGIIAPIGFTIIMLVMAQFISMMGIGCFFPYAIPGLLTVPKGTEGMEVFKSSYIILALTSIVGFFGTIFWWRTADQH